jgi:hypothetical protein
MLDTNALSAWADADRGLLRVLPRGNCSGVGQTSRLSRSAGASGPDVQGYRRGGAGGSANPRGTGGGPPHGPPTLTATFHLSRPPPNYGFHRSLRRGYVAGRPSAGLHSPVGDCDRGWDAQQRA